MTNVAFIGLGIMGNPMAGHLAKAGHSVTGFNRHPNYADLEAATDMLGRPHEVRGIVEHGDPRGREWGFPTANVAISDSAQLT